VAIPDAAAFTRMVRAPEKIFTGPRGTPRRQIWDICALKNTQRSSELRDISPCRLNTGAPVPPSPCLPHCPAGAITSLERARAPLCRRNRGQNATKRPYLRSNKLEMSRMTPAPREAGPQGGLSPALPAPGPLRDFQERGSTADVIRGVCIPHTARFGHQSVPECGPDAIMRALVPPSPTPSFAWVHYGT